MPVALPPLTLPLELRASGEGLGEKAAQASAGAEFTNVFEAMVVSANQQANAASDTARAFASGSRDDIHGTMLAVSKADIELRVLGSVRNKVIDAFYELWRMQI